MPVLGLLLQGKESGLIMGEIVQGKIVDMDAYGFTVRIPYQNIHAAVHRQYEDVTCELHDGRRRSLDQNKKAWALMGEIGEWMGVRSYAIHDEVYIPLREKFTLDLWESLQKRMFRLSKADMSGAKDFISFLVDFCLDNDVPTKVPLYEHADDIQHYVYSCLMHKKCAVCGKPCDLHHVDRVGMGRDRTSIDHHGLRCLPLCREHHQEAHQHGDAAMLDKYHLETVTIDDEIIKLYKLGGKK